MHDRYHGRWADAALRLGGAALGGVSWLSLSALAALHPSRPHADPGLAALALAAAGFLCASLCAGLVTQGRHLFDPVEIGERWRIVRPLPDRPSPQEP